MLNPINLTNAINPSNLVSRTILVGMLPSLWSRWKAFAHRAARVQSNIILTILYFLVLLPLALVRRLFANTLAEAGIWHQRPPAIHDLNVARRQF